MGGKKAKVTKREKAAAAKAAGSKEKVMQKSAGGSSRIKSGSDSGFVFAGGSDKHIPAPNPEPIVVTPTSCTDAKATPSKPALVTAKRKQLNTPFPLSGPRMTSSGRPLSATKESHTPAQDRNAMSWSSLAGRDMLCQSKPQVANICPDGDSAYTGDDNDTLLSDDDACPLCMEAMDETDQQFFPCPCGYQICLYCFNHVKDNLVNQCPACRTPYEESNYRYDKVTKVSKQCKSPPPQKPAESSAVPITTLQAVRPCPPKGFTLPLHVAYRLCSFPNCTRGEHCDFAHTELERETWERNRREHCNRGDVFAEHEESWMCAVCQNENFAHRVTCNRCNEPNGTSVRKEAPHIAHGHQRDTSGLDKQHTAAAKGRLLPATTQAPLPVPMQVPTQAPTQAPMQEWLAPASSWSCCACTFINEDASLTHCVMCNTARDDSKTSQAPPHAPQVTHVSQSTVAAAPSDVPLTISRETFPPPSGHNSVQALSTKPSVADEAWQYAVAQQARETRAALPHSAAGHTSPWQPDASSARSMLTPWRTASNSNLPENQGSHSAACHQDALGANWFADSFGSFGGGRTGVAPPYPIGEQPPAAYPHGVLPPPGFSVLSSQPQRAMPPPPPGFDTSDAGSSNVYQCDTFENWILNGRDRAPPRAEEGLNPAVSCAAAGADDEPAWMNASVSAPMGSALPAFFSAAPQSVGQVLEGSGSGEVNSSNGAVGSSRVASVDQGVEDAKAWLRSVSTLSHENIVMLAGCFDEHCIGLENLKSGDVDKTSLKEMAPRLKMGPRCNLLRAIDELRTTLVA